jgi:hypothetical protein
MRVLLPVVALIGLLLAAPAVASLYSAEVAVDDQSRAGSAERLAALDLVLQRLTGRYGTSMVDELGLGAGDLDDLMLSQQLVRRDVVTEDGDVEDELRLLADFDEPSINAVVRENGLPRWGRERPAILLWAVVEDESGTRFLESPRLEYVIRDHARRVGLEVVRPIRDAMDLAEISLQDVRGGFIDSAEASAGRYGAEVIAMLDLRRIDQNPDQPRWSGRWRWRVEGGETGLNQSAPEPEALVRTGIERLASTLAARYAVTDADGEVTSWRVAVDGIVDEVQYAEVLGYLDNLSVVEDVRVVEAAGRRIVFQVRSGGEDIASYLALGGLLELRSSGPEGSLEFRLAR